MKYELSMAHRDFATVVSKETGIAEERLLQFLQEHGAERLLDMRESLCDNERQRQALEKIFHISRLLEQVCTKDQSRANRLESIEARKKHFRIIFKHQNEKERMAITFLSGQKEELTTKVMAEGTVDHIHIPLREIVKEALFQNASFLFLAHNHPSGGTTPSNADIRLTEELQLALDPVNIRVLDHIIVGKLSELSFAEERILEPLQVLRNRQKREASLPEENQRVPVKRRGR